MTLIGFAARAVAENASVMPGIGDEPAPNLHRVFTDWTFSPTGGSVILLASLLYMVLARRVRICGGRWPLSRSVAWWCAVASLTVAIDSSVAVYSGALFWVHMLQHLLLIMVVPVLLVCAQPIRLLQIQRNEPASPSGQVRLVLRWVTSPVLATVLYAAVLITTHLTGFQQLMQTHMWVHAGETMLYLLSGYLLFGPLIGNEAWPWRLPYLLRFVFLAVTMGVDTLVGVVLMLTDHPLAPGFAASHPGWGPGALVDQSTAGAVMWFGGDGLMMILMIVTAIEWGQSSQQDSGLGGWLEGIRRRELLGTDSDEQIGDGEDVDLDERALRSYDATLAALNGDRIGNSGFPGRRDWPTARDEEPEL